MQQRLLQLPYELLVDIFAYLSIKDLVSVLSCHPRFYYQYLQQEASFWFDICRVNGINYRHPEFTWRDIVYSSEVQMMCPHLSLVVTKLLQHPNKLYDKQNIVWTTISKFVDQGHLDGRKKQNKECHLCLDPSCNYSAFSIVTANSSTKHEHPVMLRISELHILELWCTSCMKTIGFHGFNASVKKGLISERYIMTRLLQAIMQPSGVNEYLCSLIRDTRRAIEVELYSSQSRYSTMHIIDRRWYLTWLQYLSGKSNELPGILTNDKLFRADASLDPKLSLGRDFELISSQVRWYIERVYGVADRIISYTDLPDNSDYCKLLHSIQIDHINHISRYPLIRRS